MSQEWNELKSDSGIWKPEQKDEKLEGEVIEIKQGPYGLQLTVETADGGKVTTPSHKALQTRIGAVKAGDIVRIVFVGTDLPKVKGQNPTRLYSVFIKNPEHAEDVV